ncbi:MAG: C40 family peptidase [Cocleimonas sp.]|nr:C40 family peptidase [Cocleimonas sp.]
MKTSKTVCLTGLCVFLLSMASTASATQKNAKKSEISAAQMQQAYQRLLKKPTHKSIKISKKRKTKNSNKKKATPVRHRVVATAKKQIRKKYRWGGSTPKTGFDCSGLTRYAFKSANIHLPRTAAAQYKHTKRVSLSKMQAGDLIFFHTRRTRARVNHVGIYVGNGQFIHAPRKGKRVSIAKLSKYWRRKAVGAGRV